ncbi:MAG: hypothetical protein JXA20_12060 [Spirochaetes bacterium]|nr:hypothetical protein [Spirochaetota bacterium]
MKRSLIGVITVLAAAAAPLMSQVHGTGRMYHFSFPPGWQQVQEKGAVAAAQSPDGTVKLRVFERTVPNSTALQLLQERMGQVPHVKVFTPPTDMSGMAARFNADSVAKMHLGFLRPGDGKKCSYRAFVFTRQHRAVLVEALAAFEVSESVFKQADSVIESFRFR